MRLTHCSYAINLQGKMYLFLLSAGGVYRMSHGSAIHAGEDPGIFNRGEPVICQQLLIDSLLCR